MTIRRRPAGGAGPACAGWGDGPEVKSDEVQFDRRNVRLSRTVWVPKSRGGGHLTL